MNVITARPRWLKQSIGTFTPLHTSWHLVSSQVLVTAPVASPGGEDNLDFTRQSTLYTDARRGMMLQLSGGLENSKFFVQRSQTLVERVDFFIKKHQSSCAFFCFRNYTMVSAKTFLVSKKVTEHRTNIFHKNIGMAIVCSIITVQFATGWCDCIYSDV